MAIADKHVFPGAYVYPHGNAGYPTRGAQRRITPRILGVSHITGNSSLPSALAEMKYSARDGSGASFPFAVNRNGTVVQGFDPFLYAPWTNGDINKPDTSNPLIAAMVGSPYNPNEHCLITIENVGFESSLGSPAPITEAQIETNAQIYAWAARLTGATRIDINVVEGHRSINSVSRWNCPTRGNLTELRRRIRDRVNAILSPSAENDMILVPTEIFPPETVAIFKAGVKYDLWKPKADGSLGRQEYTPDSDKSARHAIGRFVLNGDNDHPAILMRTAWQAMDGWYISGWGNQPELRSPAPAADCTAIEAERAQLQATVDAQSVTIANQLTTISNLRGDKRKKNDALDVAITHEREHLATNHKEVLDTLVAGRAA